MLHGILPLLFSLCPDNTAGLPEGLAGQISGLDIGSYAAILQNLGRPPPKYSLSQGGQWGMTPSP